VVVSQNTRTGLFWGGENEWTSTCGRKLGVAAPPGASDLSSAKQKTLLPRPGRSSPTQTAKATHKNTNKKKRRSEVIIFASVNNQRSAVDLLQLDHIRRRVANSKGQFFWGRGQKQVGDQANGRGCAGGGRVGVLISIV